jgi:hypothetical protein
MQMMPRAVWTIVVVSVATLGLLLAGVAGVPIAQASAHELRDLRANGGVVVDGTLVDVVKSYPGLSNSNQRRRQRQRYCGVYEFASADGATHKFRDDQNCRRGGIAKKVGDAQSIIYDPADPSVAFVETGKQVAPDALYVVMRIVFVAAGLGLLVLDIVLIRRYVARRRQPPPAWPPAPAPPTGPPAAA